MGVPKTVINDKVKITGAVTEEVLLSPGAVPMPCHGCLHGPLDHADVLVPVGSQFVERSALDQDLEHAFGECLGVDPFGQVEDVLERLTGVSGRHHRRRGGTSAGAWVDGGGSSVGGARRGRD